MKKTGLRVAQVAAVVFAIAASAWIVVMAQQDADRGSKAQDAPTPPAAEGGTADPGFLPSSKSAIGIGPGYGKAEAEAEAEKKPTFLPSSKSLPLDSSFGKQPAEPEDGAPAKAPAARESGEPETVKEVPFLPTSKSGFIPKSAREEIERKAKEAAEAARKAEEGK